MASIVIDKNDSDVKYDPEKHHWELLREWRNGNVRYRCIRDIKGYTFRADDEQGFFQERVDECHSFFEKKINDSKVTGGEVNLNMLSHYEVNQLTGEKYLRLAVREWKTSYDPEIKQARNDKKSSLGRKDKNQNVKEYEIHSLKFYKFDEELQEFTQED